MSLMDDQITRRLNKDGYINLTGPGLIGHELLQYSKHQSPTSPQLLEHRKVYVDAWGTDWTFCADCKKYLRWSGSSAATRDRVTIDHVNGDKADNRIENLDAVCGGCNKRRDTKGKPMHRGRLSNNPPGSERLYDGPSRHV